MNRPLNDDTPQWEFLDVIEEKLKTAYFIPATCYEVEKVFTKFVPTYIIVF